MKNLLWCWREQPNSAVASNLSWWNAVVDYAQDQNDGKDELDWRCGFESKCSSDSFSLPGALEGLTDNPAALHSLCSAAASAQLSVPHKYMSSLKPVALCVGTAFCSQLCLQDQGLVLYGDF